MFGVFIGLTVMICGARLLFTRRLSLGNIVRTFIGSVVYTEAFIWIGGGTHSIPFALFVMALGTVAALMVRRSMRRRQEFEQYEEEEV